jgi:hypothetical protein
MSNGKGDTPRPISIDRQTYEDNWKRIFEKKENTCEYSGLLNTASYSEEELTQLPQEISDKIAELYEKAEQLSISIKENNNAHE